MDVRGLPPGRASRLAAAALRPVLVALALAGLPWPPALADEAAPLPPEAPEGAPPEEAGEDEPEVRAATDEEVRERLPELKKLSRKQKATDALPVLRRLQGLSHASFHAPLLKLLDHPSGDVAILAADLLRAQAVGEDPKARAKLSAAIWKSGWEAKDNVRRHHVRVRVLRAAARHSPGPLDERRIRDVQQLWRWAVENPESSPVDVLEGIALYAREAQDKRFARLLAEAIDEPGAVTNVDDPSNPPASWWEARWKLWNHTKGEVARTLEALTGQAFRSTEDARAWIQQHGAAQGIRW